MLKGASSPLTQTEDTFEMSYLKKNSSIDTKQDYALIRMFKDAEK